MMKSRTAFALLLAGVFVAGVFVADFADAQASCTAASSRSGGAAVDLPDDATLERRGATIARIDVLVDDVFDLDDPAENRLAYRWANRLHRSTRVSVICQQLLFHAGDRYSRRLFDESERTLRSDRYLHDATIRAVRYHDNQVDVEVATRDVWTLSGGVSFGRRGGENSSGFEIRDTNLLGTGKDLLLLHTSTVDRTGTQVRYRDPNLVGTHGYLEAGYGANDDGRIWSFNLGRPFYSLDTRWAARASALSDDRVDRRYSFGEVTDTFRHRQELFEISGGLSRGLRNRRARRWSLGLTYAQDRFTPAVGEPFPGLERAFELPADRLLVYPWVGFEHAEDRFVELRGFDQIERTEDHFLGQHFAARLGFSPAALGSDRDRLIYSGSYGAGWALPGRKLLELEARGDGRFGRDGVEDLLVSGETRFYWRDFGPHLFFARLAVDFASELDSDRQLLSGGDTGLRGYPLRYQDGDRRFLLTLEQRFFTKWNLFRLFNIGAAAFVDVGRSWSAGADYGDAAGAGILKDVGFGLRLGNARSGLGSVVHVDVAFPLDRDTSIDSVQFLITTKQSF